MGVNLLISKSLFSILDMPGIEHVTFTLKAYNIDTGVTDFVTSARDPNNTFNVIILVSLVKLRSYEEQLLGHR